jgi:hypothetical protein
VRVGYACGVYWIIAAVFIIIALTNPRLRPLGVVGCIVLGAMLGWGMVQRLRGDAGTQTPVAQERGRPSSPAAAPFELRGRVVNSTSDTTLKSVTIRVTRRDCYEGAIDPSGCVQLWQDDHWIAIAVPARQSRDFVDSIWMHGNAPRARGTVQDTFEVIAAAGEAEAAVEKPDN